MVPAEATPTDPPGPPPTSPGGPGPFGAQLFGTTGPAAPQPVLECEGTEAPAPSPPKQRFHLEAGWDNGLHLDSEDDRFHLHVGGNAQVDSIWLIGPKGAFAIPGGGMNGVENASATFVRRARLRMDGDIFGQFDYVVEIDFANADNDNSGIQPPSFGNLNASPSPKNVWMQIREVPLLGSVRFLSRAGSPYPTVPGTSGGAAYLTLGVRCRGSFGFWCVEPARSARWFD